MYGTLWQVWMPHSSIGCFSLHWDSPNNFNRCANRLIVFLIETSVFFALLSVAVGFSFVLVHRNASSLVWFWARCVIVVCVCGLIFAVVMIEFVCSCGFHVVFGAFWCCVTHCLWWKGRTPGGLISHAILQIMYFLSGFQSLRLPPLWQQNQCLSRFSYAQEGTSRCWKWLFPSTKGLFYMLGTCHILMISSSIFFVCILNDFWYVRHNCFVFFGQHATRKGCHLYRASVAGACNSAWTSKSIILFLIYLFSAIRIRFLFYYSVHNYKAWF